MNYNILIHLFTSTLVQSLNLCGTLGEHHSYNLLQVILAGLKTKIFSEYRSSVVIIFACLVPRVQFHSKVIKKILKSLNQSENRDIESLSMLALLFRCQVDRAPIDTILAAFLNHENVLIEKVYTNVSKQVDEDQEFAKRMLKSLALLTNKTLSTSSLEDSLRLLKVIEKALSECRPASDTAEILISCVSQAVLEFKARKKGIAEEELANLKQCIVFAKKVLNNLKAAFVEEYARKSAIRHEKDVLFIDGVEKPSAEMIQAKSILLDNETIRGMLDELKENGSRSKETLSALRTVLTTSTPFLIKLVNPVQAANLCLNCLKFFPGKFKVAKKAMNHLMALSSEESVVSYLRQQSVCHAALIIRLMVNPAEKNREVLNELIEDFVRQNPDGLIDKLMPTWKVASSEETKNSTLIKRLFEKMMAVMKGPEIMQLSKMVMNSTCLKSEDLFTLCLLLLSEAIKKESEDCLIMQLIKFMLCATKSFDIRKPKKEKAEGHKQILFAIEGHAISSVTLQFAIRSLLQSGGSNHQLLLAMLAGIWQKQSVDPALTQHLLDGMRKSEDHVKFCSALLSMPFKEIFQAFGITKDDEDAILKHMYLHAVEHIKTFFEANIEIAKSSMSFGSPVVPSMLGGLFNSSKKVRKNVLKAFDNGLKHPVARASYTPLIKTLVSNMPSIIATPENIIGVLGSFVQETRSSNAIFEAILEEALKCDELLAKLAPLLSFVSDAGLDQIALHMTTLLSQSASEDRGHTQCLALEKVIGEIGLNFAKKTEQSPVWEFFLNGIKKKEKLTLSHCGMIKTVNCALLDTLSDGLVHHSVEIPSNIGQDLFKVLIDMSQDADLDTEQLASARTLIRALMIKIDEPIVLKVFHDIWSGVLLPVADQKKTPLKKRKGVAENNDNLEPEKWLMTTFFLEVTQGQNAINANFLKPLSTLLAKALHQQTTTDHTYILDLLISTLLSIVDKLNAKEKENHPLDSELIVRCIRQCLNPDTKASALMLLAKSTGTQNAEYILHNSIQLFTFVGSHFLQMESKSNFDIACTAIDVLVPHILDACRAKGGPAKVHEMSINILNTFVDASSDMPSHRFCYFMRQLTVRLGLSDYLWLLTLLLIKADLRKKHYDKHGGHRSSKLSTEERLRQIRDLYASFETNQMSTQVETFTRMIRFAANNAHLSRQTLGIGSQSTPEGKPSPQDHFDMIKIKMLSFVHSLLSNRDFIQKTIHALKLDGEVMEENIQELLEVVVDTMDEQRKDDEADQEDEEMVDERQAKIRRHIALCYEKVFESALGILPTEVFMKLLRQLLQPKQPHHVQRKALEVLNARFTQKDSGSNELENSTLPQVLKALTDLASAESNVNEINQQLALICLKTLAKHTQAASPILLNELKAVGSRLSNKTFLKSLKSEPVVASAMLCVSEVLCALGAQGVLFLSPFVKWFLKLLDREEILSPLILNSLTVTVQKSIDNFAGFLNPYIQRLVVGACRLTVWHQQQKDQDSSVWRQCGARIKQLHMALSHGLSYHSLLNMAKPGYDELKSDGALAVVALSSIFRESLDQVPKSDIAAASTMTTEFFLHAFRYRHQHPEDAHQVEEAFGEAFLAFGLKLSLDDFKPLYYRLFSLVLDAEDANSVSTVFHVTALVANKLKSLFSFVCEMIIQKATTVLRQIAKRKEEKYQIDTVGYIFEALASTFTFNRVDSLLMKNYEDHVNALLEFLDVLYVEEAFLEKLKNCVAQLAATTEDETQWKYLNYQVLMAIRSPSPQV